MGDTIFTGPSRARNMSALPWVGDPERWGGSDTKSYDLSPAAPIIQAAEKTLFRAQTTDLISVGWDLVAIVDIVGFDTNVDTLQAALEVTLGVGQATAQMAWDLGTLSPAGNTPNPQAVALGWAPLPGHTGLIAVSGSPIIANALTGRWICQATTAGGPGSHNIRISITAFCTPRSWASPPFGPGAR